MPRVTYHGPSRPITRTGVIGYDPDLPTGDVPDPIDYADDAGWFIPYIVDPDVALVQSKVGTASTAASVAVTLDAAPTSGNLLIAVFTERSGGGGTPTLTGWTNYPGATGLNLTGFAPGGIHVFRKIAGASESATVTVTADAPHDLRLMVAEFSGGLAFDSATNASASGTSSLTTGSLTPTASISALLVGVLAQATGATFTIGGSFTEVSQGFVGGGLGPTTMLGYRVVDPTSGSYAMTATSTQTDDHLGAILAFEADPATISWLAAFAVHDGSNTTFESVTEASITGADGAFLRCVLTTDVILSSVVLRLGLEDAGSATITLEGATDEDFTTPVELDIVTQTATGSYTSDTWTFSPIAEGYVHLRFVLTTAQGARPYEVTLTGLPDPAATIADHLTDTTDAHDASAVSLLDTAGNTTATNVEDAIAELYGLTDIWRPVMAHDGTNWYVVVDGDGTAVMAQG